MFIHAKKLSITAVLALLGSAMIASPALGAPKPPPPGSVSVDCSIDGDFTYREHDPGTGVIVEIQSNDNCQGIATIPANVTSIASRAFLRNANLTSVVFDAGSALTEIGAAAFGYASALASITIPNGVTSIGGSAFYYASKLTTVTFDGDAPSVGWAAFSYTAAGAKAFVSASFADSFGSGLTWEGLTLVRAAAAPVAPSAAAARPYVGPSGLSVIKSAPANGVGTAIGDNLESIDAVYVGGLETTFEITDIGRITFDIGDLIPGKHVVKFYVAENSVYLTANILIVAGAPAAASSSSKLNAGSFDGYVAVYAKGHAGKTLAWKIAGKWFKTTITSDYQVFQRRTAEIGLDVDVHLYIDGEKQLTKTIATR
jgi:hypothetical protein